MSLRELIKDFPGAAATVQQIAYVWGKPFEIVQFSNDSIAVSWYLPPTSDHQWEVVRTVIIAKNGGVVDWSLKNSRRIELFTLNTCGNESNSKLERPSA